jgi:hypothetical protein
MNKDAIAMVGDEIGRAQRLLERAEAAIGEVAVEYFNQLANNPDTAEGRMHIAYSFDDNRVWSEIALDYAHQLREALASVESLAKSAGD